MSYKIVILCADSKQHGTSSDSTSLTENEKYIGSLLLRHLQILQFNAHEVSELLIERESPRSIFIGGAVYPSLALFNHSCNPGIVRFVIYIYDLRLQQMK